MKTVQLTDRTILRKGKGSDNSIEIFDGYELVNQDIIHVCRKWNGQKLDKVGDFLNSRIVVSGEEIDYGDDPRPFLFQGKIAISSNIWSSEHGFRNHLLIKSETGSWERYYLMPPQGLPAGKNWTPFEGPDGRLYFIHSFSPLRILREIRREKGIILLSCEESVGIPDEVGGPDGFPAHRGGTSGKMIGGLVAGFGHTTRLAPATQNGTFQINPYSKLPQTVHRPFFWLLDLANVKIEEFKVAYNWDSNLLIIDPTSIIINAGELWGYLYTTEVTRDFIDVQGKILSVRYTFTLKEFTNEA